MNFWKKCGFLPQRVPKFDSSFLRRKSNFSFVFPGKRDDFTQFNKRKKRVVKILKYEQNRKKEGLFTLCLLLNRNERPSGRRGCWRKGHFQTYCAEKMALSHSLTQLPQMLSYHQGVLKDRLQRYMQRQ